MDPTTDLYRGCRRRTLDETAGWTDFSAVEKLAVLMQLSAGQPRGPRKILIAVVSALKAPNIRIPCSFIKVSLKNR